MQGRSSRRYFAPRHNERHRMLGSGRSSMGIGTMEIISPNVIWGAAPNPALFEKDGSGDGSGYGYGDGDGYGYGDGYGSGDGAGGDGYGYGYGYGDGYGSGDGAGGDCYGCGNGSGYGDGSGDGYGDRYGSGSGDGSKEYWLASIDTFASKWPERSRKRLSELRGLSATIAFWRSGKDGLPSNGGKKIKPAAPG